MDPEFQRVLIVVLMAGSAVIGTAAVALFFAFRAFGGAKAGRPSHFALLFGLVAFIFLCCLVLFRLS